MQTHMRDTRAQTPITVAWNAPCVDECTAHARVRRVHNHANHGTRTHTWVHAFAMRWRACLTACTRAFALGMHFMSLQSFTILVSCSWLLCDTNAALWPKFAGCISPS
eukprot:1376869-Pleurochrysis_carterae.AAC.4